MRSLKRLWPYLLACSILILTITWHHQRRPSTHPLSGWMSEATVTQYNRLGHIDYRVRSQAAEHQSHAPQPKRRRPPTSKHFEGLDVVTGVVKLHKQGMRSYDPVTVRFGKHTLKAAGMNMDTQAQALELRPPIRATISAPSP